MTLDERKLSEESGTPHAREVGVYELTGIVRGLAHIILGKNPSKGDREECLELCKLAGIEIDDLGAAGVPATRGPFPPMTDPATLDFSTRLVPNPTSAHLSNDPLVAGLMESRPPEGGAARLLTEPIHPTERDPGLHTTPPSEPPLPEPAGTQPKGDSRRDVSDRKGIIGGSDWGDVYAIPPFGCRRRLAYRFEGQVDTETALKPAVMRGKALEPIVLQMAGAISDLFLLPITPLVPWWEFHADGFGMNGPEGNRLGSAYLIEAKAVGKWSADNMRKNGPPQNYQLQCQAGMHTYGLNKAILAVLDVESWKLDEYEIKYDRPTVEQMIEEGERFVQEVAIGALPDPFEPDSRACKGCAFFNNCHT